MKRIIHLAVASMLICGTTIAAVPVRWTAETSRVQPIALDAWHGDTLALECTLKSYGQPVTLGAATASLMWQTNGMGSAWWQTNATVSADGVIRATWSPAMDPGASAVAFFLPVQTGDGASYRAAGTLRFRPSPGAGSQIAELPQPGGTLDFGAFQLVNAPWATLEAANEAISAAVTSATGALVIPPPVDLTPYATTGYVAGAITSATGALVIPPPADLTPYATTGAVALAVQASSNALAGQIQAASNAAMPRAEMATYATQADVSTAIAGIQIPSLAGYATENYVADYVSTNMPEVNLSGYATQAYADAAASNAQAAAIAAIPSVAGYATENYVADYVSTNMPEVNLSGYATQAYADAVASNAQASAVAQIPSLAGYATETYAQTAAASAASDVLAAAKDFARDLSWATSEGNTRLVTLDGTLWQDATGTIWQVSAVYGWRGIVLDLQLTSAREILFTPVETNVWTAGSRTNLQFEAEGNMYPTYYLYLGSSEESYGAMDAPPQSATNLVFQTPTEQYSLFAGIVGLTTTAVDRVVYESDIEALTGLDAKQDVLPYPTNAIPYSVIADAPPSSSVVVPSTNAAAGTAADARATGYALYTGYTEWVASLNGFGVRWDDNMNGWQQYDVQTGFAVGASIGQVDSVYLEWDTGISDYPMTATRHLITPTKTSQLQNDGSNGVPFALRAEVSTAADAATNYTDAAISTNNAAFVSAVLAVPLTGADAGDLAEIAEYGGYGTVGAAILALIAGLAALKRRVTSAETALSGKADSADLATLTPKYPMVAVTPSNGTITIAPYSVATYTAGTSAASFTVALGAGTAGIARDCELVIDCTATGAVAPTVTWPATFHPRTDAATDFACEAGVRNVYFISEYATGEFAVGGWQETAGGNA